ncbi:DUF6193 family natural product biosynthesis protein [Streptomyces decoyicus]
MIDDMSTETVVETTWRQLLEHHPDARRGSHGAIKAASAALRLRQLFPFLSATRAAPGSHAFGDPSADAVLALLCVLRPFLQTGRDGCGTVGLTLL